MKLNLKGGLFNIGLTYRVTLIHTHIPFTETISISFFCYALNDLNCGLYSSVDVQFRSKEKLNKFLILRLGSILGNGRVLREISSSTN
jgi:hypothetical protein